MTKRSSLLIAGFAGLSLTSCSPLFNLFAAKPIPQTGDGDSVAECLQSNCKSVILSFGEFAVSAVRPEKVQACGDVKLTSASQTYFADNHRDPPDGYMKLRIRPPNPACF